MINSLTYKFFSVFVDLADFHPRRIITGSKDRSLFKSQCMSLNCSLEILCHLYFTVVGRDPAAWALSGRDFTVISFELVPSMLLF